jgi:hypothetical protein
MRRATCWPPPEPALGSAQLLIPLQRGPESRKAVPGGVLGGTEREPHRPPSLRVCDSVLLY